MFDVIRDLWYLASEAAYVPIRLAQALAEGVALGWRTAHSSDDGVTISYGPDLAAELAAAEAEQEVWEPAVFYFGIRL